jgi:hypothetical protein
MSDKLSYLSRVQLPFHLRYCVSVFVFPGILCTCAPPPKSAQTEVAVYYTATEHAEKLEGFWLGRCIANWTGLVTKVDKIGKISEIKTGAGDGGRRANGSGNEG